MNDISLNIHIISRLTHNYYAREFRKLHLTMGQFPFVLGIAKHDGISQEKLSAGLRISKSTTAVIIQQLLKKKLITRETDDEDRRNFKLHITKAGYNLIPQIHQIIDECHQRIAAGLSEQEKKDFAVMLEHVRIYAETELTPERKLKQKLPHSD